MMICFFWGGGGGGGRRGQFILFHPETGFNML